MGEVCPIFSGSVLLCYFCQLNLDFAFWKQRECYWTSKIILLDCFVLLSRLNFRPRLWPSCMCHKGSLTSSSISPGLLMACGKVSPYGNSESDPFVCVISPRLVFSCNPRMCTLWKYKSCLFIQYFSCRPATAVARGQPVITAMCSLAIANVSLHLVDRPAISAPWGTETFQTVWPVTATWEGHWPTPVTRSRVSAAVPRRQEPALARY